MTGPLLIGIDVGTSVIKSVVFDRAGREIAVARRIPEIIRPRAGWSEIDMDELWRGVLESLGEVLRDDAVDASAVLGIGVSGNCCSSWLVDRAGRPVRNAILWNDGRAADIVHNWQNAGVMDELFDISGNVVFPGYTVAVLRWLKDNEPEVLQRAHRTLFCKDWIRLRLTGELATEHTDAGSIPYDIEATRNSERILNLCGVADLVGLLPEIREPDEIAGGLLPEVAGAVGLPAGLPVVHGMVDVSASTLGAGAVETNQACSIIGTSFLNCFLFDRPSFAPAGTGIQQRTVNGKWLRAMVNTSGTINIDWFVDQFCAAERERLEAEGGLYAWAEAEAKTIPIGSGGVIYHPYLNNAGVISPVLHPAARAQFFGIGLEHTRAHLLRAVYEGTALSMKDCAGSLQLEIDEWLLAGGGKRSAFWCQMFADCIGKTMLISDGEELGARGVAMLAGVATGVYDDIVEAASAVRRIVRAFDPDPDATRRYERLYRIYRSVFEHLSDDWWDRRRMLEEFSASVRT